MDNSEAKGKVPYNDIHRFFDVSPDLLAIGSNGYFMRLNPAWEETLGFSTEELMSQPAISFVHPDDVASSTTMHQKLYGDGGVMNYFESRFRHKDGSYRWLEWTVRRYPGEEVTYSVARDITPRKEAQEALRQSQEAMRGLLDAMPDFAIMGRPDGTVVMLNQRHAELFGKTVDEVVGQSIYDFAETEEIEQERRSWVEMVTTTGEPLQREIEHNGRKLETYLAPVRNEAGDVVAFVASSHDITRLKQTEEALRQTQEAMRALLDGMSNEAILVQVDGTVLVANQRVADLYSKTVDEMIGQNVYHMTENEDRNRERRILTQQLVESGQTLEFETIRNGKHFDTSAAPIRDSNGQVVSIVITAHDITHLKQTEEALRQSQEKMRALLDGMASSAVMVQVDGTVLAVNQTAAAVYGKSVDEIVGQNIYDLIDDEGVNRDRRMRGEQLLESGQTLEYETIRNGRHFNTVTVPIRDSQGNLVSVVTTAHDITRLKQTEAALRQSEQALRGLLDSMPDMAVMMHLDGRVIAINQRQANFVGKSVEEIVGQNMYDLIPSDNITPERLASAQEAIAHGKQSSFESELDGQYFETMIMPVLDSEGETSAIVTSTYNITHLKQTEIALRKSEALFRNVLELAADGIILTNKAGEIILINHQAETQFGYSRENVIGQSVDMLVPDALREKHTQQRQVYLKNPSARKMNIGRELMGRRKDGSLFPMEVSLGSMEDNNDLLVIAFIVDITERKQIEQERLDYEKLQLEINKEREMIELRQRFMSMISHEFRTPLTVIASTCEILEHYADRLSDEQRNERVAGLNAHVHTMVALLDDILMLSKIQAGMVEFSPEPLELELVCRRVLETASLIDRNRHEIGFIAEDVPPIIHADPRILEHILSNLLSNAIKYSPPDTQIEFKLSIEAESVVFTIRDRGRGIPEDAQARLFEPFHRARNVTDVQGTGLGLAIVKSNVELHGGSIRFVSIEGKGTTFWVELPLNAQLLN